MAYLLFAVLVTLLAFNLYQPGLRHPHLRAISFLSGWLVLVEEARRIRSRGVRRLDPGP